ncbi:AIG2 family protein OS=Tsukamurella paurometabola (strain ATCC 8368 / DSM / CCUG 35730 / CIP 100753 / JCM 10117 / KCTC 9821 / NBRC 16120 / NCIMB 702349/ NCTC 13040) OX=521096 GN=Tpau_1655 PE=4 SV=1 [Tsukamurella paurometabola]|uniref:AIG2 family protein n=1 Tax=Tsukamurella paurometabola (strain ATCC 8368 / DSM 20162 / CCUG 35730 / CIP 100753 / JCM 10117 / KCTC 9821 / NBRC 16120 / NCIMB 702349 / NCTC 13040) TaxID=521096 RepID=D5UYG9_TSUPD|nr:gamma-glutamylcyclotransferase family protein [Tsukamurella paurometabola]ADG78276.1 AIG2 family protein [Tsukamurella paurometabola DSM 20162]SUP30979.1 AIG2-like family [Tsukamurella paurometabola]
MTNPVFSYGTLRLPSVQAAIFGGPVPARAAALVGYRSEPLTITDPAVIARSGTDVHPMLVPTGDPGDRIEGTVLELDDTQLAAADDYEVDDYRRVRVLLESGEQAWVYAFAG